MPTATINGLSMYYETEGSGFPLIFVHGGFGGLGTGLEPAAPAWRDHFAEHFEVITYDRRASGRSGYPDTGFSMADLAMDVRGLMDHLGHARAHVWGTSAGGQITLAFGLEHAGAAASLVVADSAPWLTQDEEVKAKLRKRIAILAEQGTEAAYQARSTAGTVGLNLFAGRAPMSEEEQQANQASLERIRAALKQVPREERIARYAGELRNYAAYVDWDASPLLSEMKPPTLVLYGTKDSVFPEVGSRTMIATVPGAEPRAFEGAEHGVTRFPEALDTILDFLQRHTPSG
jgi:pimeloyl-ACP methyl ester carboxylesterase